MNFHLGFPEMVIIFAICLFIFGPRRLPTVGKGLGDIVRDSGLRVDQTRLVFIVIGGALMAILIRLFQIFG